MQANRTVQGMVCHVCERGCLHADQYVLEEVANQPAKNNNHCRLAGFAYERRDDCDCAVPQGVHVAHPASCLALLSPATPPTVPLSLALLPAAAPPPPPPAFPTVKPSMQTCTGDFALQPEPPILHDSPPLPLFLHALAGMLVNSLMVPVKSKTW